MDLCECMSYASYNVLANNPYELASAYKYSGYDYAQDSYAYGYEAEYSYSYSQDYSYAAYSKDYSNDYSKDYSSDYSYAYADAYSYSQDYSYSYSQDYSYSYSEDYSYNYSQDYAYSYSEGDAPQTESSGSPIALISVALITVYFGAVKNWNRQEVSQTSGCHWTKWEGWS